MDDAGRYYQEARNQYKAILRRIRDQLVRDHKQGQGYETNASVARYAAVKAKLIEDASQPVTSTAETRKRKHKDKREMKSLTTHCKKPKKGSNPLKGGWTDEGIQYVHKKMRIIKQDEDSGIRRKWEETYKKLLESVKQIKEGEEEEEDGEPVDLEMMLVEV
jgi:hypothetical protein